MADEQTPQQPEEAADAALLASEEIADRVAWVWGRVHRIPKSGKHPSQGYNFATESDIADHIRALCAQAGIVIRQRLIRHKEVQIGTTSKGNPIYRHNVRVGYTLCVGGREWPEQDWKGSADDSSDKGLAKALTACRKTYLIAMFQVSSGDDPDGQPSPEIARGRERRSGPPQGRGQDQPYTPAPTAESHPPVPEQLEQVKGIRAAMVSAGVYPSGERVTERDVNAWIKNHAERSIGRGVSELNRDEFQALLENLALQAGKLVPGFSFNAESGEVTWDAEKPQEASGAAGDQNPAEPVEGPPAAAEAPSAPVSPASPEAQQAIEEQAAQAKAGADPDNPPMSAYEHYIVHAQSEGVGEEAVIAAMLAAGAGKPEDLERQDVAQAFEVELQKVINAAKEAGS